MIEGLKRYENEEQQRAAFLELGPFTTRADGAESRCGYSIDQARDPRDDQRVLCHKPLGHPGTLHAGLLTWDQPEGNGKVLRSWFEVKS